MGNADYKYEYKLLELLIKLEWARQVEHPALALEYNYGFIRNSLLIDFIECF
jgi:hypothetical protein